MMNHEFGDTSQVRCASNQISVAELLDTILRSCRILILCVQFETRLLTTCIAQTWCVLCACSKQHFYGAQGRGVGSCLCGPREMEALAAPPSLGNPLSLWNRGALRWLVRPLIIGDVPVSRVGWVKGLSGSSRDPGPTADLPRIMPP